MLQLLTIQCTLPNMHTLRNFWDKEYNLSVFLLLLFLVIFVITPLANVIPWGGMLFRGLFGALLLLGVSSVLTNPLIKIISLIVVLTTIVIRELREFYPTNLLALLDLVSTTIMIGLFMIVLIRRVFSDGTSNIHRVRGAIAAFLSIALFFAHLYTIILLIFPGSFTSSSVPLLPDTALNSMTYFSSITITTTGFGDIAPVHPIARSLVALEAFIGIFFPTIMVARLVSLMIQEKNS